MDVSVRTEFRVADDCDEKHSSHDLSSFLPLLGRLFLLFFLRLRMEKAIEVLIILILFLFFLLLLDFCFLLSAAEFFIAVVNANSDTEGELGLGLVFCVGPQVARTRDFDGFSDTLVTRLCADYICRD